MKERLIDFVCQYYDGCYEECKKVVKKISILPIQQIKKMYNSVCHYFELEEKIDKIAAECENESETKSD